MTSNRKFISLIFLACGFLCWLLFREVFETVWALARFPVPVNFMVKPWDMIAIVAGVVVFIVLYRNTQVVTFTNEVISELSKVVWPARKETALSTVVVTVLVGICSIILFGFDMFWGMLVSVFYQ
jgi:preprotein translocase subunit SecE